MGEIYRCGDCPGGFVHFNTIIIALFISIIIIMLIALVVHDSRYTGATDLNEIRNALAVPKPRVV